MDLSIVVGQVRTDLAIEHENCQSDLAPGIETPGGRRSGRGRRLVVPVAARRQDGANLIEQIQVLGQSVGLSVVRLRHALTVARRPRRQFPAYVVAARGKGRSRSWHGPPPFASRRMGDSDISDIDSIPTAATRSRRPRRDTQSRGNGSAPTSPRSSVPRPRNCVRRESIPASTPWIIATRSASSPGHNAVTASLSPAPGRRPGHPVPEPYGYGGGRFGIGRRGGVGWIAILVALFAVALPAGRFLHRSSMPRSTGCWPSVAPYWRPASSSSPGTAGDGSNRSQSRPQPRRSGRVLGAPSRVRRLATRLDGGCSGCRLRAPCGLGTRFVVSVSQPGRTRRRRGGHRRCPASRFLFRRRRRPRHRGRSGRRCGARSRRGSGDRGWSSLACVLGLRGALGLLGKTEAVAPGSSSERFIRWIGACTRRSALRWLSAPLASARTLGSHVAAPEPFLSGACAGHAVTAHASPCGCVAPSRHYGCGPRHASRAPRCGCLPLLAGEIPAAARHGGDEREDQENGREAEDQHVEHDPLDHGHRKLGGSCHTASTADVCTSRFRPGTAVANGLAAATLPAPLVGSPP